MRRDGTDSHGLVSSGVDKPLLSTEVALGILAQEGFAITFREEEADVFSLSTPARFIEAAEEGVPLDHRELAENNKDQRFGALIVAGVGPSATGTLLTDLPALVLPPLEDVEIHRPPQAIGKSLVEQSGLGLGEPVIAFVRSPPA